MSKNSQRIDRIEEQLNSLALNLEKRDKEIDNSLGRHGVRNLNGMRSQITILVGKVRVLENQGTSFTNLGDTSVFTNIVIEKLAISKKQLENDLVENDNVDSQKIKELKEEVETLRRKNECQYIALGERDEEIRELTEHRETLRNTVNGLQAKSSKDNIAIKDWEELLSLANSTIDNWESGQFYRDSSGKILQRDTAEKLERERNELQTLVGNQGEDIHQQQNRVDELNKTIKRWQNGNLVRDEYGRAIVIPYPDTLDDLVLRTDEKMTPTAKEVIENISSYFKKE